jgi:hypothetical protein
MKKMRYFKKMLKSLLAYFILSLIVLQSGTALVHAHQSHQSSVEYLYHDDFHDHSDELKQHIESAELLGEQNQDCGHCCHGHACTAILVNRSNFVTQTTHTVISNYSEDALTDNTKPFIRPPIAHS